MSNKFILLVEGSNDAYFLNALLDLHNFKSKFCTEKNKSSQDNCILVKDARGKDNILQIEKFEAQLDAGDLDTIAIILDADDSLKERYKEVKTLLENYGYENIPEHIPRKGLITDKHKIKLITCGIWIMPNNNINGILEDFLQLLIPNQDTSQIFQMASNSIEDLMHFPNLINQENRFKYKNQSKALIRTWLAWQEEPGQLFGKAIKNPKILDCKATEAKALIEWLKELFPNCIEPQETK